jgi:hypothetical protein
VCAGKRGTADAYDWNFCWKVWDALRDCAYHGTEWSDGVPVAPLKIQDAAPIGP